MISLKNIDDEVVSDKEVLEQLEKLFLYKSLADSTRLKQLLEYLVTETLKQRSIVLKGYKIGIDVFGKDENFDPQTDAIVRVQISKLRNVLNSYYLGDGRRDTVKIIIPKGKYRPSFVKNNDYLDENFKDSLNVQSKPRVAVLPFKNIGWESDYDYFSDGITEEIITNLTRFRQLSVLSRGTTFYYKEKDIEFEQFCEELDIQYVLQGSIRRSNSRLRVTVNLLNASNGLQVWANNYDRELTANNILQVKDDISAYIGAHIAQTQGVISKDSLENNKLRRSVNTEAYDAILKSYAYIAAFTKEKHAEVRELLEKAIEIDPEYSHGWAMLAGVYIDEYRFGYNPRLWKYDARQQAFSAALKAVELDNENATAYLQLANAYFIRSEIILFKEAAETAIALNPYHSDIIANLGIHLAFVGEWDRGMGLIEQAKLLNPAYPDWYYYPEIFKSYLDKNYLGALEISLLLRNQMFYWTYIMLAMVHGQLENMDEAEMAVMKLKELRPDIQENIQLEFRKWNFNNDHVNDFIQGLKKAGL